MHTGPHATRIDRRVWFQPLLLLAGLLMFVPVTVRRAPPELVVPVLVTLGLMAAASLAAHLAGERLHGPARTVAGWGLTGLAGVMLLGLAVALLPDQPEHALPFAAAVAIAVAPARRSRLRLPFQALLIGGMGVFLLRAGHGPVLTAIAVLLLSFVVWLIGVLATSMLGVRREQLAGQRAAERRAELLDAVADLSSRDLEDAARTVVDTLRALGFEVAGVSVERAGELVPLALGALPPAPGLRVGEGLAGAAVAEDRTVIVDDYDRDERRLPERSGLGSAIAVPVRVDGRPAGVVLGGREVVQPLPPEVVEVAEVMAGHLGAVLEVERRVDRQRELLERMQGLEAMRGRLLMEVSEEVRDPLTVVRGISETLVTHADRLPDAQRERLLAGFVEQARALRATIDALLDFSRLQAARPLPALGLGRVADVLPEALDEVTATGDLDAVVRTDPVLLGRALEALHTIGPITRIEAAAGGRHARLRCTLGRSAAAPRSRLLLGLTERLVVGVGAGWAHDGDVVELVLPLEDTPRAEEGP